MNTPTNNEQTVKPTESASATAGATQPGSSRLSLGNSEQNATTGDDEFVQLQAELHRHKVEEGRVKSLAGQLKEKDSTIAEMQKELEALKAQSTVDYVPPELRETVDQDILQASSAMIGGTEKKLMDVIDRRVDPLQQELARERQARAQAQHESMDMRIDQTFPGFAPSTNAGGANADKWNAWMDQVDPRTGQKNGVLVREAYDNGRFEGVNALIGSFMQESGISRRENMEQSALPANQTPFVEQNNANQSDQTRYTMSQYKQLLEESRVKFQRGQCTAQERQALIEKLTRAAKEGRVVAENSSLLEFDFSRCLFLLRP